MNKKRQTAIESIRQEIEKAEKKVREYRSFQMRRIRGGYEMAEYYEGVVKFWREKLTEAHRAQFQAQSV